MQLKVREENVSQGGEQGSGEGVRDGVGVGEEEGWALVPQVTWSCYNPQRRPLKAVNTWQCQQQVVPQSFLSWPPCFPFLLPPHLVLDSVCKEDSDPEKVLFTIHVTLLAGEI